MKKQLVIIGIVALLVCVGLSGCNEISNPLSNDKTLPGKTKVTGDTGEIEILSHQFSKQKWLYLDYTMDNTYGNQSAVQREQAEVPWNISLSEIVSNFTVRKNICDTYFFQGNPYVKWNNNYSGFVWSVGFTIKDFQLSSTLSSCKVLGTAKNIGNSFLNYPTIIINFYNSNGAWLASETASHNNIPSGYTWNFDVSYDGEFRNDVSYISFEVDANPYG